MGVWILFLLWKTKVQIHVTPEIINTIITVRPSVFIIVNIMVKLVDVSTHRPPPCLSISRSLRIYGHKPIIICTSFVLVLVFFVLLSTEFTIFRCYAFSQRTCLNLVSFVILLFDVNGLKHMQGY